MAAAYRYRQPNTLRPVLLGFLGANIFLDACYAALCLLIGVMYPEYFNPMAPYAPAEEATGYALVGVGLLQLVVYLTTVVLFCCWIYRANANARALGARGMENTPGWAVGWWFIPILNLWKPFVATREVFFASNPDRGPTDWKRGSTPAFLGLWWAAWLGSGVVGQIDSKMAMSESPQIAHASSWTGIATGLLSIVAAALVIRIIRRIDQRQLVKAAEGAHTVDPTCLQCGYDLRGSVGRDTCPECGTPIPTALAESQPALV